MQRIAEERQAQPHERTRRFILGNPHGGENPTKFLNIEFNQV